MRAWMRDGFRDPALFRESFARARAHRMFRESCVITYINCNLRSYTRTNPEVIISLQQSLGIFNFVQQSLALYNSFEKFAFWNVGSAYAASSRLHVLHVIVKYSLNIVWSDTIPKWSKVSQLRASTAAELMTKSFHQRFTRLLNPDRPRASDLQISRLWFLERRDPRLGKRNRRSGNVSRNARGSSLSQKSRTMQRRNVESNFNRRF